MRLSLIGFSIFYFTFIAKSIEKSSQCPTSASESISAWKDTLFTSVIQGHYQDVRQAFKTCFGSAENVPLCLSDLQYYNDYKSSPKLGKQEVDELYDKALTLRNEDSLPKEFWAKGNDQNRRPGFISIPANLFELSKEKGWKVSTFKTRDRGGFDKSHNLLIIAIPGKDQDIFMQTSIDPDEDPVEQIYDPEIRSTSGNLTKGSRFMTMITVDKTQKPPVGQLRKLTQDMITGQYKWSNSLAQHDQYGTETCIQCHTTPLRPVSPVGYLAVNGKEKLMSPAHTHEIDGINDMLSMPGVSWGKTMHKGKEFRFGAPIDSQPWGWAPEGSVTRKQEFIENCAAKRQAVFHRSRDEEFYQYDSIPKPHAKMDWRKISRSMNCVGCHNGKDRGVLPSEFQEKAIAFKVVVTREMPHFDDPDVPIPPDLNEDERLALLTCLKAEREAVRSDWEKSGWWIKRNNCEIIKSEVKGKKMLVPAATESGPRITK